MKPTSKIKAFIFDVGDILYDATLWRKWLCEELGRYGKEISYPQLVQSWEALLVDVYKGNADYWETFSRLMRDLGLDAEQVIEIEPKAREMGQSVQIDRKPMPEVRETLAELHQRSIPLVALSDTESGEAGIRKTLNQLKIEPFFHAVVSSAAIGFAKPEPEAFDFAIRSTGWPKEQCGFVAHDVDELDGARQHGLLAIGYNYDPAAPADVYIENFSELLDLV